MLRQDIQGLGLAEGQLPGFSIDRRGQSGHQLLQASAQVACVVQLRSQGGQERRSEYGDLAGTHQNSSTAPSSTTTGAGLGTSLRLVSSWVSVTVFC